MSQLYHGHGACLGITNQDFSKSSKSIPKCQRLGFHQNHFPSTFPPVPPCCAAPALGAFPGFSSLWVQLNSIIFLAFLGGIAASQNLLPHPCQVWIPQQRLEASMEALGFGMSRRSFGAPAWRICSQITFYKTPGWLFLQGNAKKCPSWGSEEVRGDEFPLHSTSLPAFPDPSLSQGSQRSWGCAELPFPPGFAPTWMDFQIFLGISKALEHNRLSWVILQNPGARIHWEQVNTF